MTKKCLGCGVILQDSNNNKEGYVDTLDKDICERCFKLKYYGEYKEVSLTNKEYQSILSSIPKDSLVVYLTSLLSLNLNIINDFDKTNKIYYEITKDYLSLTSLKRYHQILQ